jgi:hypothetical protein
VSSQLASDCGAGLCLRSLNGNAPPGSLRPCPFVPSFDRRIWQQSV